MALEEKRMQIERVECRNRTSYTVVDAILRAPLDFKWVYHTNLCVSRRFHRSKKCSLHMLYWLRFVLRSKLMQIPIYTMAMMSDKQTYTKWTTHLIKLEQKVHAFKFKWFWRWFGCSLCELCAQLRLALPLMTPFCLFSHQFWVVNSRYRSFRYFFSVSLYLSMARISPRYSSHFMIDE